MKLWITVLCVIIVVIVPASGVFAYSVNVGDSIILQDGLYGTTNGGEFIVTDTTTGTTFTTFCLETDEYISYGTPYKVESITNAAIEGGSGGPEPDPLDERTAFLYYNYAMGTLDGISAYEYGKDASANDLQQAIWYIEGETGGVNNYLVTLATTAGWKDIGDVRVMNLVDSNGNPCQSQLTLVPEPCTLLLLGAGIIGVGLLRKRFKR